MQVNKNPEYFLTVARERSISKAAEKLYVSQPYLSQHILRLEESFHTRFFNRETTPLTLTPAGEIYARSLESSRQLYQKLLQEGDYSIDQKRRNKRMAAFPGIYWCIVTAIYLGYSFYTGNWDRSWIIWPVAGVLFAACVGIVNAAM